MCVCNNKETGNVVSGGMKEKKRVAEQENAVGSHESVSGKRLKLYSPVPGQEGALCFKTIRLTERKLHSIHSFDYF